MTVEGSEAVRLGRQVLQKDEDYTINYFSGDIYFINLNVLNLFDQITIYYQVYCL